MKKFFLFLFFLLYPFFLFANINWQNYSEKIYFTDEGREVEVKIKGKIELGKNYFYKEWDYIFDKNSKIKILEAKLLNKKYKSSFGNNHLKFQFEDTFNNEYIEIYFKYISYNTKNQLFSRQEYISIPKSFKNAIGKIDIQIPRKYSVYSLNPLFKIDTYNYNYETYNWSGKITKNGFSDWFYLTLRESKWNINILSKISSNTPIKKIDIKIPSYFKNGNYEIEKYDIKINQDDNKTTIENDDENIQIKLNDIESTNVEILLNTILKNNFDKKQWIKLNPNDYLSIDTNLKIQLKNLIYNNIHPIQDKPLYISIGEWVYKYIEYDSNYYGKDMTTYEILNVGKGVCEHYAQLYNDLLKSVDISSITVSGESYDIETNKFEGHAWNLIYYNGEWIQVDPTWGLFSGKLPASHIFLFLKNDKSIINYTVYNMTNLNGVDSSVNRDINFIKENN